MADGHEGLPSRHRSISGGPVRQLHLTEAAVRFLTADGIMPHGMAYPPSCIEAYAEDSTQALIR